MSVDDESFDGRFQSGKNYYQATVPQDVRDARKINKVQVEQILNQYLNLPFGELQAAIRDPTKTTMEVLVMSILIQAIKKGDHDRLNFVLDRLIGRVKNNVSFDIQTKSFHEQAVDYIESIDAKSERIE